MKEASGKDERTPFVIGLNFFEEVLVHHGSECSVKTSLETLGRLSCDLDSHLQKTQRELGVWLASDPESELFMNLNSLRVEDVLHLGHELKGQMAVVQDNPFTSYETSLNHFKRWLLHFFTH